jgi:hypothetical protein
MLCGLAARLSLALGVLAYLGRPFPARRVRNALAAGAIAFTAASTVAHVLATTHQAPAWVGAPFHAFVVGVPLYLALAAVAWVAARHDRAHWAKRLDEHGLIWAPVARITESIDNPQVQEMRWIAEVAHPVHGRFQTLDTPFKIYGSDVGVRGPAPEPGQHTFDILAEFGVSEDEVSELAANGVLG